MPHKHKSSKLLTPASSYDLPPSRIAHALPTTKGPQASSTRSTSTPKSAKSFDDTPRAFSRLFAHRPPRSGLDDGSRSNKKRKISAQPSKSTPNTADPAAAAGKNAKPDPYQVPKLQHNEPLSVFSARVDAALPFSGIQKSASAAAKGLSLEKGRKTKTERKMQKMQKDWREEDRRLRQKMDEDASSEEDVEENDFHKIEGTGRRKGKRRTKGKIDNGLDENEEDDDDDDPWAKIAAKRKAADALREGGSGSGGLVGLHDVVQAPPRFTKVPTSRGSKTISGAKGGLKKQVELSEARQSVIEGYRAMMRGKRAQAVEP